MLSAGVAGFFVCYLLICVNIFLIFVEVKAHLDVRKVIFLIIKYLQIKFLCRFVHIIFLLLICFLAYLMY